MSISGFGTFSPRMEISGSMAWTEGPPVVGIKSETNIEEFEVTPEIGDVFISEHDAVNNAADPNDEEFDDGAFGDDTAVDDCTAEGGAGDYCCNDCGLVAGGRRALVRHIRDDHLGEGRRKRRGGGRRRGAVAKRRRRRGAKRREKGAEEPPKEKPPRKKRRAKPPIEITDPTEWITFYTAERGGGRGFSCNACDFDCLRLADFKRHVAVKHSTNRVPPAQDSYSALLAGIESAALVGGRVGEEVLRCQVCCYEANSQSHLTMHMKVHGTSGVSDGHSTVVFPCEMCGFKASTKSHLTKHKKVHERTIYEDEDDSNKRKNLCCDICGYRTVSRQSLAVHRHNHAGRRPFACTACGYRAANRERLAIHALGHTAQGRPFGCSLCSFRTAYRRSLTEHERKHTGERPFGCQECDYRATNRSNLTRHIANIHIAGGGTMKTMGYNAPHRPYPCPQCPYRSTNRSNLTRHLTNMHSPDKVHRS